MQAGHAPDYYETLQVSRSADPLIVTKAYQILVGLYHPDNRDSGDVERFREVITAHDVLSDPIQRATYDRATFGRSGAWNGVSRSAPHEDVPRSPQDERHLRLIMLEALYTVRRTRPSRPGVSLATLAEVCTCSIEAVHFSLWYLRGKGLIENTSDDEIAITVRGVDHVEALETGESRSSVPALVASNGHQRDEADAVLVQSCRLEF